MSAGVSPLLQPIRRRVRVRVFSAVAECVWSWLVSRYAGPRFGPGARALADVPQICRVQGGNTKTIWGVGFTPGQTEGFEVAHRLRRACSVGRRFCTTSEPRESRPRRACSVERMIRSPCTRSPITASTEQARRGAENAVFPALCKITAPPSKLGGGGIATKCATSKTEVLGHWKVAVQTRGRGLGGMERDA